MTEILSQRYALLIGVGQSAYDPSSLPITVKDARAIRAVVTDPSLCAYSDEGRHFHLLLDKEATRDANPQTARPAGCTSISSGHHQRQRRPATGPGLPDPLAADGRWARITH